MGLILVERYLSTVAVIIIWVWMSYGYAWLHLSSFMSKIFGYVSNKGTHFRWWEPRAALPAGSERTVAVTCYHHRPWRRWRPSWPRKPRCYARYCRHNNRSLSRWTEGRHMGPITRCLIRSPRTLSSSGWSHRPSPRRKTPWIKAIEAKFSAFVLPCSEENVTPQVFN
jgi:hypothetical protein